MKCCVILSKLQNLSEPQRYVVRIPEMIPLRILKC